MSGTALRRSRRLSEHSVGDERRHRAHRVVRAHVTVEAAAVVGEEIDRARSQRHVKIARIAETVEIELSEQSDQSDQSDETAETEQAREIAQPLDRALRVEESRGGALDVGVAAEVRLVARLLTNHSDHSDRLSMTETT